MEWLRALLQRVWSWRKRRLPPLRHQAALRKTPAVMAAQSVSEAWSATLPAPASAEWRAHIILGLQHPNWHVRRAAIKALRKCPLPEFLPVLIRCLGTNYPGDEDRFNEVPFAAVAALSEYGPAAVHALRSALQAWETTVTDAEWGWYWLARALGSFATPPAEQAVISTLRASRNPTIARGMIDGLLQHGVPYTRRILAFIPKEERSLTVARWCETLEQRRRRRKR